MIQRMAGWLIYTYDGFLLARLDYNKFRALPQKGRPYHPGSVVVGKCIFPVGVFYAG